MPIPVLDHLPRANRIWESVYDGARAEGYSERRSAMAAWGAVKKQGYSKGPDGIWRASKAKKPTKRVKKRTNKKPTKKRTPAQERAALRAWQRGAGSI